MDWHSYEELVKDIYEVLGKSGNIRIVCWGPACKVRGKSGVDHQVDVLTSHSVGIHTYRTAIECKYWKKKITKDHIAKLSYILEDAQIEKGVVVSSSGFTSIAKTVAKSANISLVELRKPVDDDWKGRIKSLAIIVYLSHPEFYDFEFMQADISDVAKPKQFDVSGIDVLVNSPNGESVSLDEIVNSIPHITDSDAGITDALGFHWVVLSSRDNENAYAVTLPDATTMSFPTGEDTATITIREIRFKVKYGMTTQQIEIRGEDYVYMVMYAVFENKRFAISPDGEIREFGSHS